MAWINQSDTVQGNRPNKKWQPNMEDYATNYRACPKLLLSQNATGDSYKCPKAQNVCISKRKQLET